MDLERLVTARLLVAYSRLYTTLAEIKRNNLAYKSYGKAREYQQELFANGRSTTGELIEAEQRLTDTGQALVNAIKAHNQALIDFNYESGTLLTRGVGPIDINYANLAALPYEGLPTPVNRATPAPVLDPDAGTAR
jgi:outer membrane protein TolC